MVALSSIRVNPCSDMGSRSAAWGVGLTLTAMVLVSGGLSACDLRRGARLAEASQKPRLRFYLLGGAAGAVEPCGCVKDMLGGVDHAAALTLGPSPARATLSLAAGPLFFQDPEVPETGKPQAILKAEAMALALKQMKLSAWAPGANDFALGSAEFERLTALSGATPLSSNVKAKGVAAHRLLDADGVKVGLVGVGRPIAERAPQPDLEVSDAGPAVRSALAELQKGGAQVFVLLSSLSRGEALRLVEKNPEFQLAVLGKPFDRGEHNDPPFDPEVIGTTLVVQGPNHIQGVVSVDYYVEDGRFVFADGSGLQGLAERSRMKNRLIELRARVARAEQSGAAQADLMARKEEIRTIEAALTQAPNEVKPQGSHFRYAFQEVREGLGSADSVRKVISEYYQSVNEKNRELFANHFPRPVEKDQASFIGAKECSTCHAEEYAFWLTTRHHAAYEPLVVDHKQYNLDCVSCHVTGYEQPGGSTVTHVGVLEGVQCEICHGPGSLHREKPKDPLLIRPIPPETLCADTCHHPPHVKEDWRVSDAWPQILGPGHGKPAQVPAK